MSVRRMHYLTRYLILSVSLTGIGCAVITKGDCKQKDEFSCSNYQDHKTFYCHQPWAKDNCKMMCGNCAYKKRDINEGTAQSIESILHKGCDSFDHFRCPEFQGYKDTYCAHLWMRTNCKYMCGICEYSLPEERTPSPSIVVKHPNAVTTIKVSKIEKEVPGCEVPDDLSCFDYEGQKGYYCNQPWLKENCKYMCQTCEYAMETHLRGKLGVTPTAGCDRYDDQRCYMYEEHLSHYCNHKWMQGHCKYTCGICKYECSNYDNFRCFLFQHGKADFCQLKWLKKNCQGMCDTCSPKHQVKSFGAV